METDSQGPLTVDRLAEGTGTPILVVDFVQFSATRPLSEELGEHSRGHPVYRIDPVTDLTGEEGYRPLDALADGYAAACARHGLPDGRLLVVGYCSAAPLALRLAARLASTAQRPPGSAPVELVLVVPTWPDAKMIAADFAGMRTDLGVPPAPAPDLDRGPGDAGAERSLRQMHRVLRQDLLAMARRHGIDPGATALTEMSARYRAWLGFLLAGRDEAGRQWPSGVVAHVLAGAGDGPVGPAGGETAEHVVRLPVPEREVLGDARLPEWVLGYAAAGSGAAR